MIRDRKRAIILGALIAQRRGDFSQAQFGRRCGVSQPTISRIEHGEIVPNVFDLTQIAAALDTTSNALLNEVEDVLKLVRRAANAIEPSAFDRCDITGLVHFVLAARKILAKHITR